MKTHLGPSSKNNKKGPPKRMPGSPTTVSTIPP